MDNWASLRGELEARNHPLLFLLESLDPIKETGLSYKYTREVAISATELMKSRLQHDDPAANVRAIGEEARPIELDRAEVVLGDGDSE